MLTNKQRFRERLRKGARQTHRLLYIMGIQTVRICKRTLRRTRHFFRPVVGVLSHFFKRVILRPILQMLAELLVLFTAAYNSVRQLRTLQSGLKPPSAEAIRQSRRLMWHHIRTFTGTLINIVAPVLSLILLFNTIHHWSNQSYGLALQYNGKNIGLVENEAAVEDLIALVANRLQAGNAANAKDVTPTYVLTTMSDQDRFTPGNALCDAIVSETTGLNLEEATGLYVDGQFIAAVHSEVDMRFILQTILKSNESNIAGATAAFIEDVELVNGIYISYSILTSDEMRRLLNTTRQTEQTYTVKEGDTPASIASTLGMTLSQLQGLNPNIDLSNTALQAGDSLIVTAEQQFLSVKMQKKITYNKSVPYTTVTEKNPNLYVGTSKVVSAGVNGVAQVVDMITYIEGVEVSRETISTTVIKQPVNRVVQVGTKKKPTISSVSTGKLSWPVPSSKRISDGFGYVSGRYHGAIDIVCSYAKVVAADGGQVVSAGWHYGYGWNVLVQHSNGLQTFYAHLSRMSVSKGQIITKGSTIGYSGSSGSWSTGPHLHFEVRLNGNKVNPLRYVSR
ncbi:MAG: peptidoglycan DD-metalloendopeptidase family protein [Clostridia bacterium]|nr:peptidoglycan DD-metalloendopeptidase family protein [Clostridia bacterium]